MATGEIIDRILPSNRINSFFDNETIKDVINYFGSYLDTHQEIAKESIKNGEQILKPTGLKISDALKARLNVLNNIKEFNQSFSFDEKNNLVFGFFPSKLAKYNGGDNKIYKGLIPVGENEYAVADVILGVEDKEYIIKDLKIGQTFLQPNSSVNVKRNGKIVESLYSYDNKGLISVNKADYYGITDRMLRYNRSILEGSKSINSDLLDIVVSAGEQTASDVSTINLFTATRIQGPLGIKINSYRNATSEYAYISGKDLSSILSSPDLNQENFYKIQFDKKATNEIKGITAYSNSGKLIKNFKETDDGKFIYKNLNNLKRDRLLELIDYEHSRLAQELTPEQVKRYNAELVKLYDKNSITYEQANKLAKKIILEHKTTALNAYGFNAISNNTGQKYVDDFYKYYEEMKSNNQVNKNLEDLYQYINHNIDVGVLTGNIYEGRVFDNYLNIAKQSANALDKYSTFSQSILNPLDYANVDSQRKAQGGDKLPNLILNTESDNIDVTDITRGFFSSIDEMKYKQNEYRYLQRENLLNKYGSYANIDETNTPNYSKSMIKVLYADTPLAFQDSDIYTNSAAMQVLAMKDNKKDFRISYSSLNREVFGETATDSDITEFFDSLQKNNYDLSKVKTESNIESIFLQNLLGEENYNKYLLSQSADIKNDLIAAGYPLRAIKVIEGNEEEYAKASSETTGKLNAWLNKYFMKSDGESSISILNKNAVTKGTSTGISGSNYALLESVNFDEHGINLRIKNTIVQGHGSKVMADQLKGTTQVLTNLLGVRLDDGTKMFFEGIVNEKPTKGTRGFAGTFFARSLATMAYNSLYGELADGSDIVNGVVDYKRRFENFKSIMSKNTIPTASKGTTNIFELFNIDMRFENGSIIFDDKNVQTALDITDETKLESLNANMLDAYNENLKKVFGRTLTKEDERIVGVYAQDLLYSNYDKVLETMTERSAKRSQIKINGGTIFKDYVAKDKVGITDVHDIQDGFLLISNFSSMIESKRRKTEDGLKLGRLSAITLTEFGFSNIVDYMEREAKHESIDQVRDYISLSAPKGTEFARGEKLFNSSFNRTIDIMNDDNVYNPLGTNIDLNSFLKNSPIGRLMDFDVDKEKLNTPTKGIITGFSQNYLNRLKDFFDVNKKYEYFNTLGSLSQLSIMQSNFHLNSNQLKELGIKYEDYKKLKTMIDEYTSKSKVSINVALSGLIPKNGEEVNIKDAYENFRSFIYRDFVDHNKGKLDKETSRILKNVFEYHKGKQLDSGINFYKAFVSMANIYNYSIGEDSLSNNFVNKNIYNYNLNKSDIESLFYYFNKLSDDRTGILKSFYNNYENIKGENIYNIVDLEQISKFGNIPFIINSLSKDENGKIVPNKALSNYENIIKISAELQQLEKQKGLYSIFTENEFSSLINQSELKSIKPEILEKANYRLKTAFDKFSSKLSNPEDIEKAKEYINEVYNQFRLTNINFSELNDRNFVEIFRNYDINKKYSNISKMISEEVSIKLREFKENTSEITSSNIKNALHKLNIEISGVNQIQQDILKNSFDDSGNYFVFKNFKENIDSFKRIFKGDNSSENLYNDVLELEKKVYSIIGDSYRKYLNLNNNDINELINFLDNGNDINQFINIVDKLSGVSMEYKYNSTASELIKMILSGRASIIKDIDKQIKSKEEQLTSRLLGRTNYLSDILFNKDGILYEMSTIAVKNSSAFSPREASVLTTFIANEMKDVIKNQDAQGYKDLRKALSLTYGDEVLEETFNAFDELYNNKNLTNDLLENSLNEIKDKIDDLSHVVIGTTKDMELINMNHLFGEDDIYYGFLSRHPHQYKYSLSPVRFVRLNEENQNLSFWGKYLGSGNKIESTQSNLMLLGKRTALSAKGDFDGDVFQIMYLGEKSLSANILRNRTARAFAKEFDKKSQLFYMMNNMAGTDLKSIFEQDKLSGSKYKSMKKLIREVYFKDKSWNDVRKYKNIDYYNAIETDYLNMSHEKVRVLKTLKDEHEDHAVLPVIKGFYGTEDNKVSKQAVSQFLLTLDDETRFRYLFGNYDADNLYKMIVSNSSLSASQKEEMLLSIGKDNGKTLLKAMEDIKDDKENLLFPTLYASLNNYPKYTGIVKTGEVHDKLSAYREVTSTLMRKEEMKNVTDYFENSKIKFNSDFYDSDILRRATLGHTIGDLIEKLAISSKKGAVSPTKTLNSFADAEKTIEKSNFNYNLKRVGFLNTELQSKSLAGDSTFFDSLKSLTFEEFFASLYRTNDGKPIPEVTNENSEYLLNLKKAFLTISKGYSDEEIDRIINNKNITMGEVLIDSKKGTPEDLITMLSNWSTIMFKGIIQRDTVIDDMNTNTYATIFRGGNERNFYKRTKDLFEIIKEGKSKLGTRFNSLLFSKLGIDNLTKTKEEVIQETVEDVQETLEELSNEHEPKTVEKVIENQQIKTTPLIEQETKGVIDNHQLDIVPDNKTNDSITVDEVINNRTPNQAPNINTIPDNSKPILNEIDYSENKKNIDNVLDSPISKKLPDNSEINEINDISSEMKKLNDKIDELTKKLNDSNSLNETKDKLISELNEKLNAKGKFRETAENTKSYIKNTAKTVTNSDFINKAKKQIPKHKTKLAIAGGIIALSSFFRIFQSNRPVVNLDINEQQYERSQGSLYRNLGQYTINTNIRELY